MSTASTSSGCEINTSAKSGKDEPKKLKPCCACPETKRVRDECIIQNGEEHCSKEIEAHKKCMRDLGFNV